MDLHIERDGEDVLRALAPGCEALAEFLEQDVGENPVTARWWLTRSPPDGPFWTGTGNAYRVVVGPTEVEIQSLFARPPLRCVLPLSDFRHALQLWSSAC